MNLFECESTSKERSFTRIIILIFQLVVFEFKLFVNFLKFRYFLFKLTHLRSKLGDLCFVCNVLAHECSMLLLQKKYVLFQNLGGSVFVNKLFDFAKDTHSNLINWN